VNRKIEAGLVCLGPALLLAGFFSHRLWTQWPTGRFGELVVVALTVLGLATLAARWSPWSRATLIAVTWLLLLMFFAGVVPVLATTIFFLAAAALGGLMFPQRPLSLQTLLAAMVMAGVVGWLLPLPIHHVWVYLPLCLMLIAWRREALRIALLASAMHWREAIANTPRTAIFAVTVVGLATTAAWLPTMQYDDLTYHLRLPWQLQEQGFYMPAPQFQIWALAPWASDVLQALPQLIGGQEARGPVNVIWLIMLAAGLWEFSKQLGASATSRWLAIALVASLPLTAAQTASMQTELLTATALVWMAALIAGPRDGRLRFWLALAVLAGGLAAMKLVAAAIGGLVLVWALIRHPWPSPTRILVIFVAGLGVAGSSYLYAWVITGNPLLPLFNSWFKSPYMTTADFNDARWHSGFGWDLLWKMTFDTDRYLEAYKGAAGFVLVALCGIWLLSLLQRRTRAAALIATGILLLPLIPLQYLRYAYPGLVLLCAVIAAAGTAASQRNHLYWLLSAVCLLNLSFQANGNWMLHNGALKATIRSAGRDAPLTTRFAPERTLAAAIRSSGDPGNVLLLDVGNPMFAEFGSRGRTVSWYSPTLHDAALQAERDPTGQAWSVLIREQDVHHVVLRTSSVTPAQRQALKMLNATHRQTAAEAEWWDVSP
jgi:hypothetical protein